MPGDTRIYLIIAGALPALVAMYFVDRLDRKRPEPRSLRMKVAFVGALSVLPVLLIDGLLEGLVGQRVPPQFTYNGSMVHAYFFAAAVEEMCKIEVVYWVVWRRPEFDERMDGIVYAGRAGLGFALVENVLYMLGQHGLSGTAWTWVLRACLAVPGHAMWSGMIGYLAARRRFDKQGPGLIGGYLLAVAAHGSYDYVLFAQQPLALEGHTVAAQLILIAPVAIIALCFFIMRRRSRTALALDDIDAERLAMPAMVAAEPA